MSMFEYKALIDKMFCVCCFLMKKNGLENCLFVFRLNNTFDYPLGEKYQFVI